MAYDEQVWDSTSYVTPTRMNHIEDGIASAGVEILATVNSTQQSRTGVSLLNELYTELSAFAKETIFDGFLEWGGMIFRCSMKDSNSYVFESVRLSFGANTATQISVFYVASSGSKFERVTVNMSTSAVATLDLSDESFNAKLNFYGKSINETT